MSRTVQKRSLKRAGFFVILGLSALLIAGAVMASRTPQNTITRKLRRLKMDEQSIRFWVAVSAFETAGWTSRVFGDSMNLFNVIVPGSVRLPYGEGQTIFKSLGESVDALINRVWKPFNYPMHYATIDELVRVMKSKGYFTAQESDYVAGVKKWYAKLFQ